MALIYRLDAHGGYEYVGNVQGDFVYADSGEPLPGKGTYVGNLLEDDEAGLVFQDSGEPGRGKGQRIASLRSSANSGVVLLAEGRDRLSVLRGEIRWYLPGVVLKAGKGTDGGDHDIAGAAWLLRDRFDEVIQRYLKSKGK